MSTSIPGSACSNVWNWVRVASLSSAMRRRRSGRSGSAALPLGDSAAGGAGVTSCVLAMVILLQTVLWSAATAIGSISLAPVTGR